MCSQVHMLKFLEPSRETPWIRVFEGKKIVFLLPLNKHAMNIWLSSLRIRAHLSWRTGKHLHVLHVLRTYSTCLYPGYQDTTTYAALEKENMKVDWIELTGPHAFNQTDFLRRAPRLKTFCKKRLCRCNIVEAWSLGEVHLGKFRTNLTILPQS